MGPPIRRAPPNRRAPIGPLSNIEGHRCPSTGFYGILTQKSSTVVLRNLGLLGELRHAVKIEGRIRRHISAG